jgi:hypothetical protein
MLPMILQKKSILFAEQEQLKMMRIIVLLIFIASPRQLYNFYNIFEGGDCVDLELLDNRRNETCEISIYFETDFNAKKVYNLLKMLKEIRY